MLLLEVYEDCNFSTSSQQPSHANGCEMVLVCISLVANDMLNAVCMLMGHMGHLFILGGDMSEILILVF